MEAILGITFADVVVMTLAGFVVGLVIKVVFLEAASRKHQGAIDKLHEEQRDEFDRRWALMIEHHRLCDYLGVEWYVEKCEPKPGAYRRKVAAKKARP